mgnify:CR=1 FL=1
MHRFFAERVPELGETGCLDPDESRHAHRVLRLRTGDLIEVVDGAGIRASAQVTGLPGAPRRPIVEFWVVRREELPPPVPEIRLCVAPPRPKAMALIVQQATELGVARLSPVLCEYGVAKPLKQSALDHWRSEAISALKQSGNPRLPILDKPVEFARCLDTCAETRILFGACAGDPGDTPDVAGARHLALWVGPEGGFSEAEQERLHQAGGHPVRIGPHILRVETAATALLGWARGPWGVGASS